MSRTRFCSESSLLFAGSNGPPSDVFFTRRKDLFRIALQGVSDFAGEPCKRRVCFKSRSKGSFVDFSSRGSRMSKVFYSTTRKIIPRSTPLVSTIRSPRLFFLPLIVEENRTLFYRFRFSCDSSQMSIKDENSNFSLFSFVFILYRCKIF